MRRLISSSTLLVALVSCLFILPACDSGGSSSDSSGGDDAIEGSFNIDVTPTSGSSGPDTTYKGGSVYVDGDDIQNAPDTTFTIIFASENANSQSNIQQGLFGFLSRSGPSPARPGTGSYSIVSTETSGTDKFSGALWEDFGATLGGQFFYAFKSGTLTLNTSNDSKVGGSIDITANAIDSLGTINPDTVEVKMTGSFDANDVDFFFGAPSTP